MKVDQSPSAHIPHTTLTHTHRAVHTQTTIFEKRKQGEIRGKALCCNSIIIGLNRNYLPQWATKRHTTRRRTELESPGQKQKQQKREKADAQQKEKANGRTHIDCDSPMPSGYIFRHFRHGQSVDCLWFCLSACFCDRGKGLAGLDTSNYTQSFVNRGKSLSARRIINKWIIKPDGKLNP